MIDYGPHGGVHGHFDKLNLILFASPDAANKGDEMGGEPRFHRYEDALHEEWTTQTVAHNTMTVDETSQLPSAGRLTVFEDTPEFKVMRTDTTASVPGALLDRTVVVLPDVVLDLYHGRSSYERTWDRTLRFQGTMKGSTSTPTGAALGTQNGYQHLHVSRRQPGASSPWTGVWETKTGPFTATVAGITGQEIIQATGPDNDALVLLRQKSKQSDFAVAYALEGWSNPVQSVRTLPGGTSETVAMEVTQRDGTVTTVFVAHGPSGMWQSGPWKSDARVLCVRRKGAVQKLLLTGGTFAEGEGGSIRQSTPGNYGAEKRADGWKITSEWHPGDTGNAPTVAVNWKR